MSLDPKIKDWWDSRPTKDKERMIRNFLPGKARPETITDQQIATVLVRMLKWFDNEIENLEA